MKIYWSNFAKTELQKIFQYYKLNVNKRIAKKLVLGIEKSTQILKANPRAGHMEHLLTERVQEFRYLVYKNYKIIYRVNEERNRIEIVDVFDTRQNPEKMITER